MATRREIEDAYASRLMSGTVLSWVFFFILGWACHGSTDPDCAPRPVNAGQQSIDYGPP